MSNSPEEHEGSEEKDHSRPTNGTPRRERGGRKRPHGNTDQHMKTGMYLKREIHFTVESPDGEQIPMRYKGEMTVESLFHQACKKFRLSESDHFMVFNNKEMDPLDTMKKFNINQNSVVKIYKSHKKSTSPDIFVSVRIRDCRIGSVFLQTDNLWDIITKLLSTSSLDKEMVPIVIYMKTELIGESVLKGVRLRDMGITHGSVILRFLQLKQEDLDQRKMKEDDDTMATLESLELKAAGPTTDAGLKMVHFRLSDDELDSENIQFIGERKALAFRLPPTENAEERVQQDYFDLLVEEISSLFVEISKKKQTNNKSELLDTVKEELQKLKEIRNDYDDVIIRVQFPDRICMQFLMLPEEYISDVKDFTRKFLRDTTMDFDLTLPHTKEVVDDQKTLADLKYVPVGRFFFSPRDPQAQGSAEPYLAEEFMLSCVPYSIGKEAALMLRGESLENFLMADSDRDSMMRKSAGGFLSKFSRTSSHSSSRASATREAGGSRSKSVWAKKQSSFQPRNWSRGSSLRNSDDDDDDETSFAATSTMKPLTDKGKARTSLDTDRTSEATSTQGVLSISRSPRKSFHVERRSSSGDD